MAFADISGFTRLSEQLAEHGPAGTEELTDLINSCFEGIVAAATDHGGDVLKIVGDGVLAWFEGDDHETRACAGCTGMHAALARPLMASTGRPVRLRMSAGAHTGRFTFVMTSGRHRELVVAGEAASEVLRCEKVADPGQTVISDALAAALPKRWVGPGRLVGRTLRRVSDAPAVRTLRWPAKVPNLDRFVPEAHRELLAIGAPGEHRQCAISFVSISGTDEILRASGPDELAATVGRVVTAIDAATDRWGTQFLSSDNAPDAIGFMLTAGVPTSSGHDEDRLLRTVRQVFDMCAPLPLRAGVHRGRIYSGFIGSSVRRGFTAVGDAVNLSARLMQGASAGDMVASRAVLDWSDTRFDERPLEPFRVKNRVALVEASVVGPLAERKARGATHDLPFTGRDVEVARLEAAADVAISGRGSVLLLLGDPGIGKSRLIVELQRRRPDLAPLDLAADEYSSTVPYSLVRTMLGRLAEFDPDAEPTGVGESLRQWVAAVAPEELPWLPLLATVFGAHATPTRETDELADEFKSARLRRSTAAVIDRVLGHPALVVIDDAQWVDDASAELLTTVISDVEERPRLVCLLVSGHDAPAWAAGATIIDLQPLGEEATRTLAGAASTGRVGRSDLEQLAGRSGGNPLFLSNLVDAAHTTGDIDSLPSTIESMITRRIDDLDARDRVMLRQAAVAGMDVELPLLGRVLGTQQVNRADVWRRLSPFLARAGPGRLRFQHGLYQRVAYDGLSFRRRREIHLALGEELEREGAEPAVLSLHFWRAENHARSYRWSNTAAVAAHEAYANTEAAELYRRAFTSARYAAGVGDDDIAGLAEALGDVLERGADYVGAADAYADARRLAGPLGPRTLARITRKLGVLREHAGAYPDALRSYSRAINLLEAAIAAESVREDRRAAVGELAELELAYAGVRYRQGSSLDARARVQLAMDHATASGDEAVLGHAHYLLTIVDVSLGDSAPASGEIALDLLERSGDLVQQAKLYNNLGIAAYFAGDWDTALTRYGQGRDASHRAGDLVLEAILANNIGEILSDRGVVGGAMSLFESAMEAFRAARYPLGVASSIGNLGRARLRAGDHDDAHRLLSEALRRFEEIGASSFVAETLVRLAECAIAAGDPAEAVALAEQAEQRLRAAQDSFVEVGVGRVRAEALLAAGRLTEAAIAAEIAVGLARTANAPLEQARSLSVRARAGRALAASAEDDDRNATSLLTGLGVGTESTHIAIV